MSEAPQPQQPGKDILQSRTFWGSLFLLVAMVLSQLDIQIDPEGWTNDVLAFIGSVMAIYGRIMANSKIVSYFGIKSGGQNE